MIMTSFPTTRFRYDTPLHDLERDDWSDEARFDLRRTRGRPLGHRQRKRSRWPSPKPRPWLAPKSLWSRRLLAPWGQLRVLPFVPDLDVGCRCRGDRDEPYEAERGTPLEEEWFEIRGPHDVKMTLTWTGPYKMVKGNSMNVSFEPKLDHPDGIYVMMNPKEPATPWYVGKTTTALRSYLSQRWDQARRLGVLACLGDWASCPLQFYAAKVTVQGKVSGGREQELALLEAVLTKLFIGAQGKNRLPGNRGNERGDHFVTSRSFILGKPPRVTLELNLPSALKRHIQWQADRANARWNSGQGVFEIKAAQLTPPEWERDRQGSSKSGRRSAPRLIAPALGFEVAPFTFP